MAEPVNSAAPVVKITKQKEFKLPSALHALELAPDAKTLFAACLDGGIFTVDVEKGEVALLGKHDSYASGLSLLPDGKTVISGGYDGVLIWHDLATRKEIRRVKAHEFWSWDMDTSPDGAWVASATGQYLSGGYKYEPAPQREPCVKIFSAATGELKHALEHVPSTQAVAFSPDSRWVAAGNIMGEIRVWEVATGKLASKWTTPDLTSWGVIKSHHYLGGVFAMRFSPDGTELYICGMGPMMDPMAGNGVQRWQRFAWKDGKKLDQTHDGESGQGLMEAFAFHPSNKWFVMAGRLFQGAWNLACFDSSTGKNIFAIDAKSRITDLVFNREGTQLFMAKALHQERKDMKWSESGRIEIHSVG